MLAESIYDLSIRATRHDAADFRAKACFAYIRTLRMNSWQARSVKPVITPISVMLIVLVVLGLFLRRPILRAHAIRFTRAESRGEIRTD